MESLKRQGQNHHEKILCVSHLRILEVSLYHARWPAPRPGINTISSMEKKIYQTVAEFAEGFRLYRRKENKLP